MLINCIECGAQISDSVTTCPKCGKYSSGVECGICKKMIPRSIAKEYVDRNPPGWTPRVQSYHSECFDTFISTYFNLYGLNQSCPECGRSLSDSWAQEDLLPWLKGKFIDDMPASACKFCGYTPLHVKDILKYKDKCSQCKLPIYSVLHGYCKERLTQTSYRIYHRPLCCPPEDERSYPYLKRSYYKQGDELEKEFVSQADTAQANKSSGCSASLLIILILCLGIVIGIYTAA
jgi:ribosomal protein L40E